MGSRAGILFQAASILLILGAVFLFLRKNKADGFMGTKVQKALAVFQIILGGGFFALCLSDVLDWRVNFSLVRLVVGLFYDAAFLSLAVYALSDARRRKKNHLQIVICACAALIAVQCFVFPYETENEIKRIFEAVEGVVALVLLLLLISRLDNVKFGLASLIVIVVMELAVAVVNTVIPIASVAEDIQSIDVPMNYAALYMRPVIFGSLTLVYRMWADRQKT